MQDLERAGDKEWIGCIGLFIFLFIVFSFAVYGFVEWLSQ